MAVAVGTIGGVGDAAGAVVGSGAAAASGRAAGAVVGSEAAAGGGAVRTVASVGWVGEAPDMGARALMPPSGLANRSCRAYATNENTTNADTKNFLTIRRRLNSSLGW